MLNRTAHHFTTTHPRPQPHPAQHDEAVELLKHAISLQPQSLTARFNLGQILLIRGKWGEALRMLREVERSSCHEPGTAAVGDWRASQLSNRQLAQQKAESERVAPLLAPLLTLCEKWQRVKSGNNLFHMPAVTR